MAIGTTAAIIGSAVIGAGASIIGGNKAAKAQEAAADKSAAVEKYMYDTTRSDYAPWRAAGQSALDALMRLYGLSPSSSTATTGSGSYTPTGAEPTAPNSGSWLRQIMIGQIRDGATIAPERLAAHGLTDYNTQYQAWKNGPAPTAGTSTSTTPAAPYGGLMTSPGYQFRLDEGIKSIDRSAAARGLLRSGATAKAVQRYGEGLAASEYDAYAARLAQLAGFGQSATAGTAAAGANYAQGASNAYMAAGNARASGYANTASSINSGLNNVMSAYLWTQSPWGKS